MLKIFAAVLLAGPLAACVADTSDATDGTDSTVATTESEITASTNCNQAPLPELPEDKEYAYYQNQPYTMQFPGYFSPQSETFFIWTFGTAIQHNAPYPSASHGRLYGVFANGPAGATHHVDGHPEYDHYHIISQDAGTRTFDVYLVFPGPNYNAATFHAPLSEHELNDAVAAGVLGTPLTTIQAGFDQLVLKVPVVRVDDHGHGHGH